MKRNVSRYALNPAQIAIFPENPSEATRAASINSELPPAPGTGVRVGNVPVEPPGGEAARAMLQREAPLLSTIPTLYCAPCGGRGAQYQFCHEGLGGIDEVPCMHCNGKGLLTQGCNPARNPNASIGNKRIAATEANTVDSPHQWVFPSPTYASCVRCKLTALTVREPDPIDLMIP